MNVDEFVVAASSGAELPPFGQLVQVMADYVAALEEAQVDPLNDPAVLILGAYIAFHTHSDINTLGGYKRLIKRCEDRLEANKANDEIH